MILEVLTALLALVDNENSLVDELMRGEWWDAITGVFSSTIGEFVFAILFILGPALLYIKTQNIVPTAMALIAGGAVLATLFTSPIRFFFAIAAVFGVAVVLFEVTKK